jgi:hypothetical protein
MRLKNMRKGPIVGVDLQKRDDDEIVNLGSQTRFVQPGQTGEFDPKSRAVRIYAKNGYLKPIDKDGQKWLESL